MVEEKFKMSKTLKILLIIISILISIFIVSSSMVVIIPQIGIPNDRSGESKSFNSTEGCLFGGSFCTCSTIFIILIIIGIITLVIFTREKKRWKEYLDKEKYKEEIELHEKRLKLQKEEQEMKIRDEEKRMKLLEIQKIKEEEKKREDAEKKRQEEEKKRQEEEKRRQVEEKKRQEEVKRRRILEEQQAHNYETALSFEEAIPLYEKLELWDDAGRCRKLLRQQKLEELQASQPKIDIGSISSIKDSVVNRSNIEHGKK